MDKLYYKFDELAKLRMSSMGKLYCKFDELDKLECKFDELAKLECKFDELDKLRMNSMSWIRWTVSWIIDSYGNLLNLELRI